MLHALAWLYFGGKILYSTNLSQNESQQDSQSSNDLQFFKKDFMAPFLG